jgi:aryl-alcohol dehydrogenase-like predicted oxidoreductase
MQEIVKTAFDNGINMIDTAEIYANGKSEEEMCGLTIFQLLPIGFLA